MDKYFRILDRLNPTICCGTVSKIVGLMIESIGPQTNIGDICRIYQNEGDRFVLAEVVGIKNETILLMPFGSIEGIGYGSKVVSTDSSLKVKVGMGLVGRIIDGIGNPIDGKGEIEPDDMYPLENTPPKPLDRKPIEQVLPLGIRAIDGFLTCGMGQRLGIFAGSGVGKSTLLGMIARNARSDVNVIILVGERGREVKEFIENDLKQDGLKKSVLVVATSDQPALIRLKCAMLGTSIAEYFRDRGLNVMLLLDSLTRFAMAQREIGLSAGEPPVSRGYTPSVFSIMPKLLERAGNSDKGSITGLYTVLVDGDDLNEPITDSVRGILDGHIVLSRALANKNHYPAIDVLASVSRLMNAIVSPEHLQAAGKLRGMMSVYRESQDLINIGAYRKGSNPDIDEAIAHIKSINDLTVQQVDDTAGFEETLEKMYGILK